MAKKSSKTTHVLNLLSGHDTPKEPETVQQPPVEAPAVSIIDKSEDDPVAEQIQENLLHELEKEVEITSEPQIAPESEAESQIEASVQADALPETQAELQTDADVQASIDAIVETQVSPQTDTIAESATLSTSETILQAEAEAVQQTDTIPETEAISETETVQQTENTTQTEAAPVAQAELQTEVVPEAQTVQPAENIAQPEPVPEPDFVRVNIMEEIVKDKIIYFMRQFECCTCDRCIADAIALTLNGLIPKYIVTDPAAKDPLVSFYTNRLISDVTVEATKACMTIKENPRHNR